jgi:hypothetical protein
MLLCSDGAAGSTAMLLFSDGAVGSTTTLLAAMARAEPTTTEQKFLFFYFFTRQL